MGFGDRFTLAALAAEIGLPMRVDAPVSGADAHRVLVMLPNGRGQLEAPDSDLRYLPALAIGGAAGVADAVWDEAEAGHVAAGSTGLALKDARDASVLTQINLGDPSGAPPGFTNLADLIGAPDDAAVDPDAANGTLYAYLKKAIADLRAVGVSGGGAKAEIRESPGGSATATLPAEPTETEIEADGTGADPGGVPPFEILDVIDVNFPEGVGMTSEAVIKSIFATLKWT